IPVIAAVNVGALTSASTAASNAASAASDAAQGARAAAQKALPSIISVQILGFGDEPLPGGAPAPGPTSAVPPAGQQAQRYTPNHMVQVLARGSHPQGDVSSLTPDELRSLGL